jgi:hypothetical protein
MILCVTSWMPKYLPRATPKDRIYHATALAIDGWPVDLIAKLSAVPVEDARSIHRSMLKVWAKNGWVLPRCACGARSGHRPWCSESPFYSVRKRKIAKPYSTWRSKTDRGEDKTRRIAVLRTVAGESTEGQGTCASGYCTGRSARTGQVFKAKGSHHRA